MCTHTHICACVRTQTHTQKLGLFLQCRTVDPGVLLFEKQDQSNSADPGRRRKKRTYKEMTLTSAFTLIISLLDARETQVAQKLRSIHP